MEKRRLGRLGHMSSVLIFGGAALSEVEQKTADEAVRFALDSGINHFDTAASYGNSELRLGPWMKDIRGQIFLSTKTEQRSKDGAAREIEESLERLQVDDVDLIQLHAIGDVEQLDQATSPGGALEAAVAAKEQGLVKAIGITGHGHEAPATHLKALKRGPFDTVLTPLNYLLYRRDSYRSAYDNLVEEISRQDAGLMVIKPLAKGLWREDEDQSYSTWYEPFDEQDKINAAVAFVLSRKEVTGLPTAGDVRLLPKLVEAERRAQETAIHDVEATLGKVPDYSSPFEPAAGRVGPL